MKAGDIVFVRGTTPISKMIKYFDKGKFSHVAIALSDTHVLEAQYFTKTRITSIYYENYEVLDLDFTDEQREEITHYGIDMTGKLYDYNQILWYVLKRLFDLKNSNKFNNPNNFICSELIYDILKKFDLLDANENINADVTPNQLYDFLMEFNPIVTKIKIAEE